jgi:hypothetical protein
LFHRNRITSPVRRRNPANSRQEKRPCPLSRTLGTSGRWRESLNVFATGTLWEPGLRLRWRRKGRRKGDRWATARRLSARKSAGFDPTLSFIGSGPVRRALSAKPAQSGGAFTDSLRLRGVLPPQFRTTASACHDRKC